MADTRLSKLALLAYHEASRAVAQYVMCEQPDTIHLNLGGTTEGLERSAGTIWPFSSTDRDGGEWAWCGRRKDLGQTIPPATWARIHRRNGFRKIVTLWAGVIAEAYAELPLPPYNNVMHRWPVQYFSERGDADINKAREIARTYLVRHGAADMHRLTWGKWGKFQYPEGRLYSEAMSLDEHQAWNADWKVWEKLREAWEAVHVDPKAAKLVRRLYPVAVRIVQNHLDAITRLHKVIVKKWPFGVIRGIVHEPMSSKQVQKELDYFYARRSQP